MAFISLKNLLIKNAARFKSGSEATLLSINEVWKDVGTDFSFSDLTKPKSFKRGVLIIQCSSLSESSHLRLQEQKIKKTINRLLKEEKIKDIKFITSS